MSCTDGKAVGVAGRCGVPSGSPPIDDGMLSTTDEQPDSAAASSNAAATCANRFDGSIAVIDLSRRHDGVISVPQNTARPASPKRVKSQSISRLHGATHMRLI